MSNHAPPAPAWQTAWERDKAAVGRAAHEAWLALVQRRGQPHPDAAPWEQLADAQRDAIINAVAGEVRYRLGFEAGWIAARSSEDDAE